MIGVVTAISVVVWILLLNAGIFTVAKHFIERKANRLREARETAEHSAWLRKIKGSK